MFLDATSHVHERRIASQLPFWILRNRIQVYHHRMARGFGNLPHSQFSWSFVPLAPPCQLVLPNDGSDLSSYYRRGYYAPMQ
jgi:hypothetical protein